MSPFGRPRGSRPLSLMVCLLGSFVALAGCLLTTELTDLTGGAGGVAPKLSFSIGGTVKGLEGASLKVTRNGRDFTVVMQDGAFTLEGRFAPGTAYIVTALPLDDGRTCSVEHGEGQLGTADVTDVAITCPSSKAALTNLVLSNAPLLPALVPSETNYTAELALEVFASDVPTMVTATASPGATLTFDGELVASGEARTFPGGGRTGSTTLTIVVQAADRKTRATYTVALRRIADETFLKASNTRDSYGFGSSAALSADGSTLVVGSNGDCSAATGINGNQHVTTETSQTSGAAFVFRRQGKTWTQEAYIKASNSRKDAYFGRAVAVSADGNVAVVTADGESSAATGVDGDQTSTKALASGAAYVFRRTGTTWVQESYLKASNTRPVAGFGASLSLSRDGNLIAIGAPRDTSGAHGIDGDQNDQSASGAGAVYVFRRAAPTWIQDAYVKASNSPKNFGITVAVASDGTLAVGAMEESSAAKGINGDQSDTSLTFAGAVYVFRRPGTTWAQEAYVKASNTRSSSSFGSSVALSDEGTLAVGAGGEASKGTGVDADQTDVSAQRAGAVYVFHRSGTTWAQDAFIKASNTRAQNQLSFVALSADGRRLVAAAYNEPSTATGINGDQTNMDALGSGAVYAFSKGTTWKQESYVKAGTTKRGHTFGIAMSLSGDGRTLAICAPSDSSSGTGVNANPNDTTAPYSGAVYVFH